MKIMRTRSFNNRGPKKYLFQSRNRSKSAGSFALRRRIDPAKFVNKAILGERDESYLSKNQFSDFNIDGRLVSAAAGRGYKMPTPIQDKIIPYIVEGLDVVGIASTGTGKTAAFLLPLINKILQNSREQILIIAPTRELALQIEQEFRSLAAGLRIFSVCCVGGAGIGRQVSELHRNHNLIIGTPGRLKDLMNRRAINLSRFNTVVLDEADRMFDMGFINDTRFIINAMPVSRQTLFFSATMSGDIERIIGEFTNNPTRISIKFRDTSKNVEQDIIKIEPGKTKLEILNNLLHQKEFNKVLIFGRTKRGVEKISRNLMGKGFRVESIHGNKNNNQRQRALGMFKNNRVQVLVATDIAARGLDIADVSHVINYDIPATYDDYIHRIGRTGRWNKQGMALTFID